MCVVGRPTRGRRACLFVSGRPPPRPYWGRSARPVRPGRPVPLDLTHGPPRPVRPVPSRLSGLLGPSHAPRGPSLPLSGRPYGPLSGISPPLKTPRSASTGAVPSVSPMSVRLPSRPALSVSRVPARVLPVCTLWAVSRPSVSVSALSPSHLLNLFAGIVYPLYCRIEACMSRVRQSRTFTFICITTTKPRQFTILAGYFYYVDKTISAYWPVYHLSTLD